MSWFSKIGTEERRFEVEVVVQNVRYTRLGNRPVYVVWTRGDKKQSTRAVAGEGGGVYDFAGAAVAAAGGASAGAASAAAAATANPPLKFECTMYQKGSKYLPKKSKLYLFERRRGGGEELRLGSAELDIASFLDAKTPKVAVKQSVTLSWGKCVDAKATITLLLRARWMEHVDVAQLRKDNPEAVSRAPSMVGRPALEEDDEEEITVPHAANGAPSASPPEVDEPATDEDDDEAAAAAAAAEAKRKKQLADRAKAAGTNPAAAAAATAASPAGARLPAGSPARANPAAAAAARPPASSPGAAVTARAVAPPVSSPLSATTNDDEEEDEDVEELQLDEEDEDEIDDEERERRAKKEAKRLRKLARAAKRAARAAAEAAEAEEEEEEEGEDAQAAAAPAAEEEEEEEEEEAVPAHTVPASSPSVGHAAAVPLPPSTRSNAAHSRNPSASPAAAAGATAAAAAAAQLPARAAQPATAAQDDEEEDEEEEEEAAPVPAAASAAPAAAAFAEEEDAGAPFPEETPDPTWTNFTGSLTWMMRAQEEEDPDLPLPIVMHKLLKAVRKLGGAETPAIFKQGPKDPSQVDALRKRMEGGTYKLKTDDPRVPAQAIKDWLASIAVPLLPLHTHALLQRVGAMDDEDTLSAVAAARKGAAADDSDDEDEDASAANPNSDPRYRKGKQAALAADLYSDIQAGVSPRVLGDNSAPSPRAPQETVPQLLERVVALLPSVHRATLHALLSFLSKQVLSPAAMRKNGYTSAAALATIFGDSLTRMSQLPGQKSYEFFLAKQYVHKSIEYLIRYADKGLFEREYDEIEEHDLYHMIRRAQRGVDEATTLQQQIDAAAREEEERPAADYSDLIGPDGGAIQAPPQAASVQQHEEEHAPAPATTAAAALQSTFTEVLGADAVKPPPAAAAAAAQQAAPKHKSNTSSLIAAFENKMNAASGLDHHAQQAKQPQPSQQQEEDEEEEEELPRKAAPAAAPVAQEEEDEVEDEEHVVPTMHEDKPAVEQPAAAAEEEAVVAEEEEEEEEEDPEEVARRERKRLRKEKKRLKREKRERRAALGEDVEDEEEEEEEVSPSPAAAGAASSPPPAASKSSSGSGLTPLHGLTPRPSPTVPQHASSPPDPFADVVGVDGDGDAPPTSFAGEAAEDDEEDDSVQARKLQSTFDDVLGTGATKGAAAPAAAAKPQSNTDSLIAAFEQRMGIAGASTAALDHSRTESHATAVPQLHVNTLASPQIATAAQASAQRSVTSSRRSSGVSLDLPDALGLASGSGLTPRVAGSTKAVAPVAQPGAGTSAAVAALSPERQRALEKRIAELESSLAQRDSHLSEAQAQCATAQADATRWKAAAREAEQRTSSAAGAAVASPADVDARMAKLTKKLAAANAENDELVEALEKSAAQIKLLDAVSAEKTRAMEVLQRMVAEASAQGFTASIDGAPSARSARAAEEERSALQARIASLEASLAAAQAQVQAAEAAGPRSARSARGGAAASPVNLASEALTQKEAELRRVQEQLHVQSDRVAQLQSTVEDLRHEAQETKEKHAQQRAKQLAASDERSAAEARRAEERLAAETRKTAEAEKARAAAQNELRTLQSRVAELEGELASLPALQTTHASLLAEHDSLSSSHSELQASHEDALSAKAALEARIHELEESSRSLQGSNDALRSEIEELEGKLTERNGKIKELVNANEQRVVAASAAAAAAAAAATPKKQPLADSDSSDEDSLAAARRRRKLSALSPSAGGAAVPPSPSPSAATALAAAQQEVLSFKQLLSDKTHMIEELEEQLQRAKSKSEALEAERSELQAKLDSAQAAVAAAAVAPSPRNTATPPSAASSSLSPRLDEKRSQLFQDTLALNKKLELLSREHAASQAEVARLRAESEEREDHLPALREQISSLQASLDSIGEVHALKVQQLVQDSASKVATLQKFKAALGEKYSLLEKENAELRSRKIAFASLVAEGTLEKKYTDPSAVKKLERKESTLLQALHESQRRCTFLESQLAQSDETLATLKAHYAQAHSVLEQELEGLERENDDLKELYGELQHAVRLGSTANSAASSGKGAAAAPAQGMTAALSIDWARYESARLRVVSLENSNAELALQVSQLQSAQVSRLESLDQARAQLDQSRQDVKALKEELVRSGLALKMIAEDNFELKSLLRALPKKELTRLGIDLGADPASTTFSSAASAAAPASAMSTPSKTPSKAQK